MMQAHQQRSREVQDVANLAQNWQLDGKSQHVPLSTHSRITEIGATAEGPINGRQVFVHPGLTMRAESTNVEVT
jgi:hypothetical protein